MSSLILQSHMSSKKVMWCSVTSKTENDTHELGKLRAFVAIRPSTAKYLYSLGLLKIDNKRRRKLERIELDGVVVSIYRPSSTTRG